MLRNTTDPEHRPSIHFPHTHTDGFCWWGCGRWLQQQKTSFLFASALSEQGVLAGRSQSSRVCSGQAPVKPRLTQDMLFAVLSESRPVQQNVLVLFGIIFYL